MIVEFVVVVIVVVVGGVVVIVFGVVVFVFVVDGIEAVTRDAIRYLSYEKSSFFVMF